MKRHLAILSLSLLCVSASWAAKKEKPQPLPAPTGLTCAINDDMFVASWDPVEDATKYSLEMIVSYDTDADGEADTSADFSFSTQEFDDPLATLVEFMLEDFAVEAETIQSVAIRLKAMNPGKGRGPQNHPFSGLCMATITPDEEAAVRVFNPAP